MSEGTADIGPRIQARSRQGPDRVQAGSRQGPGGIQAGSRQDPGRVQAGSRQGPGPQFKCLLLSKFASLLYFSPPPLYLFHWNKNTIINSNNILYCYLLHCYLLPFLLLYVLYDSFLWDQS